jgi:hypothetical protein
MIRNAVIAIVLALVLGPHGKTFADDACVDFKWDVTRERGLFAGSSTSLSAGADSTSAPVMQLNHLYALKLMPQEHVTFAATPGKKTPSAGSNAGVVKFKIPASGSYRAAIDMPFWIDVVSNGALAAAKDFQGQHGCSAPHKIVEFELVGTRPFFLQLSNAAADSVRLTITASPARKL